MQYWAICLGDVLIVFLHFFYFYKFYCRTTRSHVKRTIGEGKKETNKEGGGKQGKKEEEQKNEETKGKEKKT